MSRPYITYQSKSNTFKGGKQYLFCSYGRSRPENRAKKRCTYSDFCTTDRPLPDTVYAVLTVNRDCQSSRRFGYARFRTPCTSAVHAALSRYSSTGVSH